LICRITISRLPSSPTFTEQVRNAYLLEQKEKHAAPVSKRVSPLILLFVPAALVVWAGVYLIDAFADLPQRPRAPLSPSNDSTFIFIGDTQSPLWPETFILDENGNEEAREMLFRDILSGAPGAVFHSGDLVALGFNQSHWEPIDRFTDSLADRKIPFFPVPGNHEYMLFGDQGIGNFRARFPFARETGYVVRLGPLALVLVNSNFSALPREQIRKQKIWYDSILQELDRDTLVSGIIVTCHHAPFTNSRIVDPSEEVQKQFVPGFIASEKGLVFITGHCHAFEHFIVGGEHFLVSGGGGGLQQPLLVGKDQRRADQFSPPTEKRMFHYLQGELIAGSLRIEVRMLRNNLRGFETTHSVALPLKHGRIRPPSSPVDSSAIVQQPAG